MFCFADLDSSSYFYKNHTQVLYTWYRYTSRIEFDIWTWPMVGKYIDYSYSIL